MRLRRLEPVLRRSLRGPCVVAAGSRVLVAVSGGADSVALLLGIHRLAGELRLTLCAAHLNHGLRGAEADADAAFVTALCDRLGIPLHVARLRPTAPTGDLRSGGENGLRIRRRRFLRVARRRFGADVIATAHTADDQLETVLMRLARGTGIPGLAAMLPRRGPWIKPLLEATRDDVIHDLVGAGQPWREDSSNRSREWTRNRIRLDVIPALAQALRPEDAARARIAIARGIVHLTRETAATARLLTSLADRALERASRSRESGIALDSSGVASYPSPIRRMVWRRAWRRIAPTSTGLTHLTLDGLDRLVQRSRGASVDLPGGWRAERDRQWVIVRRVIPAAAPAVGPLVVPGRLSHARGTVRGRWITGTLARRRIPAHGGRDVFFAASGLSGALQVRAAQADEWFEPFGARRMPLGAFLKRQPIAREWKRSPVVLSDAGGILWVLGVRRAARAPVTLRTRRVLHVTLESHGTEEPHV